MNTRGKVILLLISVAGIGTAGYILTRKSKKELRLSILSKVPAGDWQNWIPKLNQMTRQELADVDRAMQWKENTPISVVNKIDPVFKARVMAINMKYNLFT